MLTDCRVSGRTDSTAARVGDDGDAAVATKLGTNQADSVSRLYRLYSVRPVSTSFQVGPVPRSQ